MDSSCFLRLGLDLEGHVDWLLEGLLGLFLNRVNGLDINLGDLEHVSVDEEWKLVSCLVLLMDSVGDNLSWILMEVVERASADCSSDSRRDSLARISNEVSNREEHLALFPVGLVYSEVPSVWKLKVELGMIWSFDLNLVSHEVWSKQETESLDSSFFLGKTAWKVDEGELFIGLKHHELGSEDYSRDFVFIIIKLDGWVVRSLVAQGKVLLSSYFWFLHLVYDLSIRVLLAWDVSISRLVLGKELFNLRSKELVPELFALTEEICLGSLD
jgi:hypothetical protein